jgi:hypothetical protein
MAAFIDLAFRGSEGGAVAVHAVAGARQERAQLMMP